MELPLTIEKVKALIENTYCDETFLLDGKIVVLYLDADSMQVWTDQPYHFDSWESFLAAPVIWGHRLSEVVARMVYAP